MDSNTFALTFAFAQPLLKVAEGNCQLERFGHFSLLLGTYGSFTMKRDMELIRKVLLAVESGTSDPAIKGYSDDEVKYHQALAIEVGLVEGRPLRGETGVPVAVMIKKLTWAGHDFVDAIAQETNWNKVKEFLKDAGKQITIDTVKAAVVHLFRFGP